jgi:hypothetical protein
MEVLRRSNESFDTRRSSFDPSLQTLNKPKVSLLIRNSVHVTHVGSERVIGMDTTLLVTTEASWDCFLHKRDPYVPCWIIQRPTVMVIHESDHLGHDEQDGHDKSDQLGHDEQDGHDKSDQLRHDVLDG